MRLSIHHVAHLSDVASLPAATLREADAAMRRLPLAGLMLGATTKTTGAGATSVTKEYVDVDKKEGGVQVVYDVQYALIAAGGRLPKYGVDGKWGAESAAAWAEVVGQPVTRDAVSELVGYDYQGPMSVFGVSDNGGGGGGGVQPVDPKRTNGNGNGEPPPKNNSTTYLAIGGAALLLLGGVGLYYASR